MNVTLFPNNRRFIAVLVCFIAFMPLLVARPVAAAPTAVVCVKSYDSRTFREGVPTALKFALTKGQSIQVIDLDGSDRVTIDFHSDKPFSIGGYQASAKGH